MVLNADVELSGTDQLFNLNVGRDLMPAFDLEPQIVMTTPLLEGLDGVEKMSKSLGNYVGVTEPASEMFGKLMSISDDLMWQSLRTPDGSAAGRDPAAVIRSTRAVCIRRLRRSSSRSVSLLTSIRRRRRMRPRRRSSSALPKAKSIERRSR